MWTPVGSRKVRVGAVGLGQIFELTAPVYRDNPDAELVALCDVDAQRLARRAAQWPAATAFDDLDALLGSDVDVVEVLVPSPMHADVACRVLAAGKHLALQKPVAHTLAEVDRIIAARDAAGVTARVMEDQVFFPPLVALREVVRSGEIGDPVGLHLKMVATGLGGWDVSTGSWEWLLAQAREGLGILVFDDGWHKFAIAHWLFGPVGKVMAWVGTTELAPGFGIDAPTTVMWDHVGGVRGVLDISFAPQTYLRSDYYSGDERVEVTGTLGFARVNRISARGIDQPALEVYRDGELRSVHTLADRLDAGFLAAGRAFVEHLRTGEGRPSLTLEQAREVLEFQLAVYESSRRDAPVTLR